MTGKEKMARLGEIFTEISDKLHTRSVYWDENAALTREAVLRIPEERCEEIVEKFLKDFPEVRKDMERVAPGKGLS